MGGWTPHGEMYWDWMLLLNQNGGHCTNHSQPKKKVSDLQRRILHGVVHVHSYTRMSFSLAERHKQFFVLLYCTLLLVLFCRSQNLLRAFDMGFTFELFIFGFKYLRKNRFRCQLSNFIHGQARKSKVDQSTDCDPEKKKTYFLQSDEIQSFKRMGDLEVFKTT